MRRVFGNTGDWISRTVIHQPENVLSGILSPGERTQVRAGVNTNFRVATMPLVTPGVNGLGGSMIFAVWFLFSQATPYLILNISLSIRSASMAV